ITRRARRRADDRRLRGHGARNELVWHPNCAARTRRRLSFAPPDLAFVAGRRRSGGSSAALAAPAPPHSRAFAAARPGIRYPALGRDRVHCVARTDAAARDIIGRNPLPYLTVRLAMYSITVSHHFMIAHSLAGEVFGPAQRLHGATYVVEAELRRDSLDVDGIVCDIGGALDLLQAVLGELEYRNLDELEEFRGRNTTTEFLARDIHRRLARRIKEGALGSQPIASLKVVL